MTLTTPVDLRPLNTLRVAANAMCMVTLDDPGQLPDLGFDPERDLVLGGGSNLLLAGNVPGQAILVRLKGRSVSDSPGDRALVRVAAGEDWHDTVRWTLAQGLSGLENLSLIPGLAGAAPIQNIGAYGVELADHLHAVEAWDWQRGEARVFDRDDCALAYRDSRFKSGEPDRYLVTGLVLALDRVFQPRLDYAGVREELLARGIEQPTALDVSDAVIALRQRKLPDPAEIGNAGSFFKNPVLTPVQAEQLRADWPDLPLFPGPGGALKSSAAWMIERCGWKGRRQGDAGISQQHALVLVNHGSATGEELAALAESVRADVAARFGVDLENEPRIVRFEAAREAPPKG